MQWKLGLNRPNDPGTIQWCIDVINSILSYSLAYDVELSRQGYCQNIFIIVFTFYQAIDYYMQCIKGLL